MTALRFALVVFCLCLSTSFGVAKAIPTWRELEGYSFEEYKDHFSKQYESPKEEEVRRQAFDANMVKIRAHNQDPEKTWKMGVNRFTDRLPHELRSANGYQKSLGKSRRSSGQLSLAPVDKLLASGSRLMRGGKPAMSLPYEVDWRQNGVVTAVKNQGQCGSCWAFAATAALESQLAIATGELYVLSVQEFVSCTPNERKCGGTGGCSGSIPQLAYEHAQSAGLMEEWAYSYVSFHGNDNFTADCPRLQAADAVTVGEVVGHYDLPTNDQEALLETVAFEGPVAISVDATEWHFYEEGVFDGCNQVNPDLNHAVVLVGYGSDPKHGDYWLVRNSWSPSWGERGYIRLRRETTPRCGIDVTPEHGTACEGDPKEQKVCGTCGILFDNSIPIVRRSGASKDSVLKRASTE
uniref:Papain family cysteine protease containing protein n=1 Tax=Tetraselmis sp. GSL018 TaxID=582737 RepID=A0A061R1U8_9CHLO|eukprot:CAMPEP_0177602384 /NCGR_PEP_ID=MMETSP0419_2-20121207/14829_1 /TAXON_ID=582737 /ORGANISM="Tetraselmis sp., Strain GSL018" /LENGTH=407 /DNA_ID=CAMNT_0019095843 /DNA_START=100 /DNA_END=1323 /DNA_ORIENTATION=+